MDAAGERGCKGTEWVIWGEDIQRTNRGVYHFLPLYKRELEIIEYIPLWNKSEAKSYKEIGTPKHL